VLAAVATVRLAMNAKQVLVEEKIWTTLAVINAQLSSSSLTIKFVRLAHQIALTAAVPPSARHAKLLTVATSMESVSSLRLASFSTKNSK